MNKHWTKKEKLLKACVFAMALCCSAIEASSAPQTAEKRAGGFDLLVKNGTIVTMDGERRIIENGVVAGRADTIMFVGTESDFTLRHRKGVTAKQNIDARRKLDLRGSIHDATHAPTTL